MEVHGLVCHLPHHAPHSTLPDKYLKLENIRKHKYIVHSAQCTVQSAKYKVQSSKCQMQSAPNKVQSTKYRLKDCVPQSLRVARITDRNLCESQ